MFASWGELVYRAPLHRHRCHGGRTSRASARTASAWQDHLSQSGWDDPGSESVAGRRTRGRTFGRDHTSDVIVLYTAPAGKTIDDPSSRQKIIDNLQRPRRRPSGPDRPRSTARTARPRPVASSARPSAARTSNTRSPASPSTATTTPTLINNYRDVKDAFYIDGVDVQVAGLQPVAGTLQRHHGRRPASAWRCSPFPPSAILLFFIFGGVVAAALPLIIGGLTVLGANGIVMADHQFHRGQLVRRARGLADRPGPRHRLRTVHRQPIPRGDGRGLYTPTGRAPNGA